MGRSEPRRRAVQPSEDRVAAFSADGELVVPATSRPSACFQIADSRLATGGGSSMMS